MRSSHTLCLMLCFLLGEQIDRSTGFPTPEWGDVEIITKLDSTIASTTPKPKDPPPIEPSLIEYISSALKPEECRIVFAMLTIQDAANKMYRYLNISSTMDYADFLKHYQDQQEQENYPMPSYNFNCTASLKYWNEELIGSSKKELVDKRDFAETSLGACLSQIFRDDLEQLLHIRIQQIEHEDLEALKDEIEGHTIWRRSSNESRHLHPNGTRIRNKEESRIESLGVQRSFGDYLAVIFLIVFFGTCSFACLLTVVTCCSDPLSKRPSQAEYSKLNSTEGGNGGEKPDGKTPQGTPTQGRTTYEDVKKAPRSESIPLLETETV